MSSKAATFSGMYHLVHLEINCNSEKSPGAHCGLATLPGRQVVAFIYHPICLCVSAMAAIAVTLLAFSSRFCTLECSSPLQLSVNRPHLKLSSPSEFKVEKVTEK